MNDFKKCPNGHYYQGDGCPYCDSVKKKPNNLVKVCSNHHAFDSRLNVCPICDLIIDNHVSFLIHDRFTTTIDIVADKLMPI